MEPLSRIQYPTISCAVVVCLAALAHDSAIAQCVGTGAGHAQKIINFNVAPAGNAIPQVRWSHHEEAFAEESAPQIEDEHHLTTSNALIGPMTSLDIFSHAQVLSTCSEAHSMVYTNCGQNWGNCTGIVARLTLMADANAIKDRPRTYAHAHAFCNGSVEARGGSVATTGAVTWNPTWLKSQVGNEGTCQDCANNTDSVRASLTHAQTGLTETHVLLSATSRAAGAGESAWQDGHLTNTRNYFFYHVDVSSPWTVEQGTFLLEVQGTVTQAVATGVFADIPMPVVGANGTVDIALPNSIELHYDLGGSEGDDASINCDGDVHAEDTDSEEPVFAPDLALFLQPYVTDNAIGNDWNDVSIVQPPSTVSGLNVAVNANHVADDFTVPPWRTYRLNAMRWPMYQPGSAVTDPILSVFVRLWNGPPGAGGTIIAGNMTSNRLLATDFANAYRVTTNPLDTQRAIKDVLIDMRWAPLLGPGTYWVEVAAVGMTPFSGPFVVPVTPRRPTDNARQFNVTAGVWSPITDVAAGQGMDFPFRLYRVPPGDMNGDNLADGRDVQGFLNCLMSGAGPSTCGQADYNGDGVVNDLDLSEFIAELLGP